MKRLCWVLVAAGLAGGQWLRPEVAEPGELIDVDLHTHTRFSDGVLSPMELVLVARRHNLDAIAVTEHNVIFPAEIAAAFSRLVGGPTVIVGEEITTRDYHLIAVGIRERIAPRADLREVIDEIHRQGGVAIGAHPVRRFWPALEPVRDVLDAAEAVHPIAHAPRVGGFRWDEMLAFHEGQSLVPVGSSDYHGFKMLGLCRTHVLAADRSPEAIVAAIREGRVAVEAPDGRVFGDPGVAARIERRPKHVGYAPSGWLDAVTRVIGWLGVVGLVLLRGQAPSTPSAP